MAVAFRSLSTVAYGSRGGTTVPVPTGVADGDILIIAFAIGQSNSLGGPDTPTIPSGWTVIQGPSRVQDTGFSVDRRLLWKVAASESAGYAFSHVSNNTCAVAIAISGGNTGATPVSSSNGRSNGDAADATVTTALSITTPAADSYVAFIVHNWSLYGAASPPTGTTPTFTERADPADNLWYTADGILASAGATGDKTQAFNLNGGGAGGSQAWGAFLVAIGPSGAAPTAYPWHHYNNLMSQ